MKSIDLFRETPIPIDGKLNPMIEFLPSYESCALIEYSCFATDQNVDNLKKLLDRKNGFNIDIKKNRFFKEKTFHNCCVQKVNLLMDGTIKVFVTVEMGEINDKY